MSGTILIDTHIFLWVLGGRKLSKVTKDFFADRRENRFVFSDASAWEISIKFGNGKLELPDVPEIFVPDRVRKSGFSHLSIELQHVLKVHSLPQIHRDPFDRLLISQAKVEDLTILTADPIFFKYPIKVMDFSDIC